MQEKGLVHIYYGDGKGKTTAAVGQAIRAAGRGWKVLVYQFLKDNESGERKILEQISNITCIRGVEQAKFSFQMTDAQKEEQKEFCAKKFAEVTEAASKYDLVLLDEVICAVRIGFLEEEKLLSFLAQKPMHTEVILTGNTPSEELIFEADYVTEMKKLKHPYDMGICARNGIER